MIKRETAIEIKTYALNAITELGKALVAERKNLSDEDFEQIKRGVGLSIARIQTELLDVIYALFPDLDDLRSGGETHLRK